MKKILYYMLIAICTLQGLSVYAYDQPAIDEIANKSLEFASQYPYKEGDAEKSLSFGIPYTSGFETRSDGVEYECPAVYRDQDALFANDFDLKKGEMSLIINETASVYGQKCVLHNGVTLVPIEVFDEIGCIRSYDESMYITTLAKNNVVLEIMPYLIGMRKNQKEGYYVPLSACARFVDNELYVPIRAVAEELGLTVVWNGENKSVAVFESIP